MGAWGTAITSDDTVADVIGTVVERLKAGDSLSAACEVALREFNSSLNDADDAPLVWLGLAHSQWKYGRVDERVLEQIRRDIATERGLERWRDDPVAFTKRKRVLQIFLEKISVANPKPAAAPRAIINLAPFREGDCLAVLTRSGEYTAAIVLVADNSRPEHGSNLVGSLDFLSTTPPMQEDFEGRKWLFKHHGNWHGEQEISWYGARGIRKEKNRITVVGSTALRRTDPRQSNSYAGLNLLGEQILLCRAWRGKA
ncbi:MAG: hypothetical protein ABI821_15240 [Pseudomonadota bacterium]